MSPEATTSGQVTHTMGWPLGANAGGGSFMYHAENNQVYVGFVVHLNYENPYLYPYMEFQRFKHHPVIADVLAGGKRVAYGARAITEGGWQSIPQARLPRRRAARLRRGLRERAAHQGQPQRHALGHGRRRGRARAPSPPGREGDELDAYASAVETGPIARDLKPVRNVKPLWSRYGLGASLPLGGLDMWMNTLVGNRSPFGTMRHGKTDAAATRRAEHFAPIDYPTPDGVALLRPADQRRLLLHQPRGEPAVAPDAEGPAHPDRHQPAALRRARAALLSGRGL